MATIAVFIALGGGAYAIGLAKNSVKSHHIAPNAVRSHDIKNRAVYGTDIKTNSIDGDHVLENQLGTVPSATDASTLDGQDSSAFLGVNGKAADANTLDGQDSSEFLGATATAADSQLLDGVESDDFARVSGLVNGASGNPMTLGITSVRNGEGDYTVTINDGTFPNSGTSCSVILPVISPVGNEFHAAVWSEAGCLTGGGARFDVLTFNAAGAADDASFAFIVDARP